MNLPSERDQRAMDVLPTSDLTLATVIAGMSMRDAQRAYFKRRTVELLAISKDAEKVFDQMSAETMRRHREDQLNQPLTPKE